MKVHLQKMTNLDLNSRKLFYYSLLFVLFFKLINLLFFIDIHKNDNDAVFIGGMYKHVDYGYYLQPVDNYFEKGLFTYNGEDVFAGRMPGYWFPYLLLRYLFSPEIALNLILILQIVLSIIAGVMLARLAYMLSSSSLAYFICLFFYAINWFVSPFDYQSVAESLSVSSGIFALYYLLQFVREENRKYLLVSGFFLAWMIFLRPFLGLSIVFFSLFVLSLKESFSNSIINVFILILPFLIFEGIWIGRNYNAFGKLIPLQTSGEVSYGKPYGKSWVSIRALVNAWGGNGAYFEPNSMSQWFRFSGDRRKIDEVISIDVYKNVNTYNVDSISLLKKDYQEFKISKSHTNDDELDHKITWNANEYLDDYRTNNWFRYQLNLWKGAKRLIISSGSSYVPLPPFNEMNIFEKFLKLFYALLYYFILISGSLGLILQMLKKSKFAFLSFGIIASVVLLFVYYSPIQEARYFIFPFIILMLYSSVFIGNLLVSYKILKSKL